MAVTRIRLLLSCALLAFAGLCGAAEATASRSESDLLALRVKAAVLFNFAKFITWPASKFPTPDSPLRICVLEPDPFGEILDQTVSGKRIDEHPLVVVHSRDPAKLDNCHLAYVPATDPDTLSDDLAALAGHATLTVHEADQAEPHGAIRLLIQDRRLRFEINTTALEQENLQVSSKLLGLALIVKR